MYGGRPGFGAAPQYPGGMYAGQRTFPTTFASYPPTYPQGSAGPTLYPRPGAVPNKSTTLYIGRIAQSVEESVLRELLESCGDVQVWKPTTDPDTGAFKGFGFCTYANASGVRIALRILNNLNVDGQQLIAKTNKATQEYIDWLEREKQRPGSARSSELGDEPDPVAAENTALEKVMSILSARAPHSNSAVPKDAAVAASEFLAGLHPSQHAAETGKPDKTAVVLEDREAVRQRRDEQRRQEEAEASYREMVRAWETQERNWQREKEREAEKERDLFKERARAVHADNQPADSDGEEPWRRKFYCESRRAAERKLRREAEEQEDAAAGLLEERKATSAEANDPSGSQGSDAEQAGSAAAEQTADAQDAIYQAMIAAAHDALPASLAAASDMRAGPKRKFSQPAFGEEDDEALPRRILVPLKYSEEELQAMQRAAAASAEEESVEAPDTAPLKAPASLPLATETNPEQLKRQLMASVPKDQAAVFAWPVDWTLLDAASDEVKQRIQGWVSKRIQLLMGEEEESFASFVMLQVAGHSAASDVLGALQDVLDEDALEFVTKLFQVIIYETLKLQNKV